MHAKRNNKNVLCICIYSPVKSVKNTMPLSPSHIIRLHLSLSHDFSTFSGFVCRGLKASYSVTSRTRGQWELYANIFAWGQGRGTLRK